MKNAMRDMLAIAGILFLLSVGIGRSQTVGAGYTIVPDNPVKVYPHLQTKKSECLNSLQYCKIASSVTVHPMYSGIITTTDYETSIEDPNGGKVILLTNSEYKHLQELREAVTNEEKRIAVRYGATLTGCDQRIWPLCLKTIPDHYEYHGQFLLIEKHGR